MCSLGPCCRDGMSGDVKATWVEREQWGLSSTHFELFSLTAMTARDNAFQIGAVKHQPQKQKLPLTPFCHCFFDAALLLFLSPALSILITSHFNLPKSAISLWLHWKQKTLHKTGRRQRICWNITAFMSLHYNLHGFKLSVLGWAVDCSPKRCLPFNLPVHEYCMASRE